MTSQAWIQLVAFLAILLAVGLADGPVAARGGRWALAALAEPLRKVESGLYRLAGVDADASMAGNTTPSASFAFNALGVLVVYALQRLQGVLPLDPQGMAAVSPTRRSTPPSALRPTRTAGLRREATMSYLTQMLALTVQNFFSAATGIVVVIALIRGFVARSSSVIGNVWPT